MATQSLILPYNSDPEKPSPNSILYLQIRVHTSAVITDTFFVELQKTNPSSFSKLKMGRGKLRMELIKNERARNTAFEKRKKGLMKAANELSTLCGVHIGMIIHEPLQSNNEPTVWPANREIVSKLIDSYKSKSSSNDCRYGTYNLSAFFKNQTEKIEDELGKLRKRTREMKYPKWDERFNSCSQDELKHFFGELTGKIDSARVRINSIKGSRRSALMNPPVDQHQQQPLVYCDGRFDMENQRMMMMMNNVNPSYYVYNNNNTQENWVQNCGFDRNGGNYGFIFEENRVQNGGFDPNFGNYGHNFGENWVQNCGLGTGIRVMNAGVSNGESLMSLNVPKVGPVMSCNNAPEFEQFMPFCTPNDVQMVGWNEQGLLMPSAFPQMQAAQEGDYMQSHGF